MGGSWPNTSPNLQPHAWCACHPRAPTRVWVRWNIYIVFFQPSTNHILRTLLQLRNYCLHLQISKQLQLQNSFKNRMDNQVDEHHGRFASRFTGSNHFWVPTDWRRNKSLDAMAWFSVSNPALQPSAVSQKTDNKSWFLPMTGILSIDFIQQQIPNYYWVFWMTSPQIWFEKTITPGPCILEPAPACHPTNHGTGSPPGDQTKPKHL